MEDTKRFGLLPKTEDSRDRVLGAAYRLPDLSELPEEFSHEPLEIRDQGETDFCTAFASVGMSELQEGVKLVPEYTFAVTKEIEGGNPDSYGAQLRDAMLAHVNVGAIEEKDCPEGFRIGSKDPSFLRRIGNWPKDLIDKATVHAKGSFMSVEGPYDAFDDIRAAIWLFRAEKRAVIFGLEWSWPISMAILDNPGNGEGHALYALGWVKRLGETYLKVANSYGKNAGDRGIFYLSRKVINKFAGVYGSYMFVDMTKEEYIRRITPRVQFSILTILQKVLEILGIIQKNEQKEVELNNYHPHPNDSPDAIHEEKPKKPIVKDSAYFAECKKKYLPLAQKIADEVGLSATMTYRFIETVQSESSWDPTAENLNPNKTTDYGIAQFNTHWYIGPGKLVPSIEKAFDPEFSLRVMASQFKKGFASDWIAYRKRFGQRSIGSITFMRLPDFLLSSTGEGLALRWKAFASGIIPALVLLGPYIGLHVPADAWNDLVGSVSNLIIAVWSVVSAVSFIYGWVRRNVLKQLGEGKFTNRY